MTITEFTNTQWGFGVIAKYNGLEYHVACVDLSENKVGLLGLSEDDDAVSWIPCQEIEITGGIDTLPLPSCVRSESLANRL